MRRMLIVCLALSSLAVSAETYRWVDPAGRTIISDPPRRAGRAMLPDRMQATESRTTCPLPSARRLKTTR